MENNRYVLLSLLLILVGMLAACNSDRSSLVTSVLGTSSENAGDEVITVNIAYGNEPDEFIDQAANKWKELAEERSDGRLQLNLYPSSQLGSEKDVTEQAVLGSNVIVLSGYDYLMDYVPDIGILTAPYLTDNFDDLLYLTSTEWFKDLEDQLAEYGISIVTKNTIYGERHLMTTEEVLTPDDLAGKKIRVPNNNMYIETFEALGASPTPMPLSDLYTSLQQGLVDGAENPLPVLEGSKTHEVANYLAQTGHTKIISPWLAGTQFLETLPEDIKEILVETGEEAATYGNQIAEEQSQEVLDQFKEQGITINEIDKTAFKEKTQSVYQSFESWTPGLYEKVQELIEER
ncbi:C4-dicarboxylate TRAP transporter substrate-binding protein [Gracilibacillus saliphilus]|uniref:C4-dicarboxylate TRAP transporter substrate-binding protein n=1 Tax=Gracilibacillus saliphilus TaxID=543890 RepID=UPI0013D54AF4|nr:C4-dicarboxylate TRAP transporter substrate-binding protein [Gracilibacillus saliphilus]